jgi:hypothetical protein
MNDMTPRLRAVCDLDVAEQRESSGRHEYDGEIQDLSPAGVRTGLASLAAASAAGEPLADPHDETHLATFEARARVAFGQLELHRRNPLYHLSELDLACYDRDYAPAQQRARARDRHLAGWPQAIEAAIESLDLVSAPVAASLLGTVRGLAAAIPADADARAATAARASHARLVAHLERAAADGDPDAALGTSALTALMSSADGMDVDLDALSARADTERDRLMARLASSCAQLDRSRPPLEVARELSRDHPDSGGVIEAARHWTQLAIEFTRDRDLVPFHDGECLVGPSPESRRWGMAMLSWAAPGEPE